MRVETCFLFDLDGTLVDSVHQHVLAWSQALDEEGIALSVWRIHRKIGISGGLFTNQLPRETGQDISENRIARLGRLHAEAYGRLSSQIRPLPGHGLYWPISLFAWALAADYVKVDPTLGIKLLAGKNDEAGFHAWTEEELARFEATWKLGTRQRLAFDLLLYTGLRRGDAVRPGRPHVRTGDSRSAPRKPACR